MGHVGLQTNLKEIKYVCHLCNKVLNGPLQLVEHQNGKSCMGAHAAMANGSGANNPSVIGKRASMSSRKSPPGSYRSSLSQPIPNDARSWRKGNSPTPSQNDKDAAKLSRFGGPKSKIAARSSPESRRSRVSHNKSRAVCFCYKLCLSQYHKTQG